MNSGIGWAVVSLLGGCLPFGEVTPTTKSTDSGALADTSASTDSQPEPTSEPCTPGGAVDLPGGTFTMGATPGEAGASNDEYPQHEVTLSPFAMMDREVTRGMYLSLTGEDPSVAPPCPECPVEGVTWHDAVAFAALLAAETGQDWRLPTEAEWEYAARGGEGFVYAGSGNPQAVAWFVENSGGQTHEGCALAPNAFGLYDMSGNVEEWTADWHAPYSGSGAYDPAGPATGTFKVSRGGSYPSSTNLIRVAFRNLRDPATFQSYQGFRLVRSVEE